MMNGTKPYGASAERASPVPKSDAQTPVGNLFRPRRRRAAILAAGSAGILAGRTRGRRGCWSEISIDERCDRRAAILAAGSAGILARRALGRQGCRPNRQAGSLPYVPLPFDRRSHFAVFARRVVAVQFDGVRLRTSRLTRTHPPSQNCGGWTLAPPKMQIVQLPGARTACNPPGCRYND